MRLRVTLVPGGRVELPLCRQNRILSPARLPVPPSGHTHVLSPADVFLACHRQRVNRQLPPSLLASRSKQIPALRVYIAAFHAHPFAGMNDERTPARHFFAGDLKTRFHLTILQAAVMLQWLIPHSQSRPQRPLMIKEELDSDKVFVLHNFLTSDECVALIRRSEGLPYEIGTVGGVVAEGIRNNERLLVDDKSLADTLFCRAAPWLPQMAESRRLVGFNERWRFYRYRPGQTFQPHRDGSYMSLETHEKSEVTFLIYLNDDMTGGETRFFADMEQVARRCPYLTVKPTIGAALVFFHSVWHEGAIVQRGEKYVLRTDVMYKL